MTRVAGGSPQVTDYTGLIVPLPDLEPVVGRWRARYDNWFAGTPAHVTVLFPWIPPAELTEADLDAVGQLAKDWQPFEVSFAEFRTFEDDDVLYLAPEPADPFSALTDDVYTVWPEYPPYEGAFDEVIPHLTVASTADAAAGGRDPGRCRPRPTGAQHGRRADRDRADRRTLPGSPLVPAGWPQIGWPETLSRWLKSAWQAVGGVP